MTTVPNLPQSEWYVFHERDDQYAVTVRPAENEEREVAVQKVTAHTEDAAIMAALGGCGVLADNQWRVWAIPAEDVRPRPFAVERRTEYDSILGSHFVR